jgi:hypothetical protein
MRWTDWTPDEFHIEQFHRLAGSSKEYEEAVLLHKLWWNVSEKRARKDFEGFMKRCKDFIGKPSTAGDA